MRRTDSRVPLSRRQFLARCGALGAAVIAVELPGAAPARAALSQQQMAAALDQLTLDTMAGLVAFVVPGPDRYSKAQGVTSPTPGGVDARAPEGLVAVFNRFLPMSDSVVQSLAAGLAQGASDVPLPGLAPLLAATESSAATVDRALQAMLANDDAVPLSLVVALALNFVAASVNPRSIDGPFPASPFANLSFAEKAEVFRRIEEDGGEVAALLDRDLSEPMRRSISGQIAYLGGALPTAAALYAYSEWGVLDPKRMTAGRRPIGWDLTGYAPGRTTPADGWKELKGYYRGHRKAGTRRRRSRRRRRRRRA